MISAYDGGDDDMGNNEALEILSRANAVVDNDHFIYKAGTHGSAYINKERFPYLGARNLEKILSEVAGSAVRSGLDLSGEESVGIIGPAMGATPYPLTIAIAFERLFPDTIFFPARTELEIDAGGKRTHMIPEKLAADYRGRSFIIFEDIVNNGTTIREVNELFSKIGNVKAALCIVDRGGQDAGSLGVPAYYPWLRVDMKQYDAKDCPICRQGRPVNTVLGKGKVWVRLFGQPPYTEDKDFSAFWEKP
jgi:orotate phosphoribosyltransferase